MGGKGDPFAEVQRALDLDDRSFFQLVIFMFTRTFFLFVQFQYHMITSSTLASTYFAISRHVLHPLIVLFND